MISKRLAKLGTLLVMALATTSLHVSAQSSEYNTGNYWIFATAEKTVGSDYENSSTGVLMNNGTIYYRGNFKNEGNLGYDKTLTVGPALSVFNGTTDQTIKGDGTTSFYNLQFSGQSYSLQQPIRIVNQMDLSNGVVKSQQTKTDTLMNAVLFEEGSSCINASDTSFVDGFVQKTGNTAFSFPIGNGEKYRPLGIAAPDSEDDIFAARYVLADPSSAGYSRTSKSDLVGEVSDKEYWLVYQVAGSSKPQVTLTWNDSVSTAIPSDLSRLHLVRWDGSKWVGEDIASVVGDSASGSIVANMTGYGAISLAIKEANRQLSVKAIFEGLWNSENSNMNQCMTADGVTPVYLTAADTVFIELHDTADYTNILYAIGGLMEPDGTIHSSGKTYVDIPRDFIGSYYLTVKSRNHIETISALPVSFENEYVTYDFTPSISQAYDNNLVKLKDGVYGIYVGDINQDDLIDNMDIVKVQAKIKSFASGYIDEDLNGDGIMDNMDKILLQKNTRKFIDVITP